jgi:hypothetical protein
LIVAMKHLTDSFRCLFSRFTYRDSLRNYLAPRTCPMKTNTTPFCAIIGKPFWNPSTFLQRIYLHCHRSWTRTNLGNISIKKNNKIIITPRIKFNLSLRREDSVYFSHNYEPMSSSDYGVKLCLFFFKL